MTHIHGDDHPTTAEGSVRQLRALRLMIVALIPIAIWTVVGMVWLWPHDTEDHIREDVSQYSVQGLTIPTAEITNIEEISCEGQAGSVAGGGEDKNCAVLTVRLLEGPETGDEVEVTLTQAQYASGVDTGQNVKLFRIPAGGQPSYQFSDFDRTVPLIALAAAFALVVVVVARWRGFSSLIGLAFAGVILTQFMFPALVSGENPILVGLIGSSAIMFVVLYTSHGFNARTTTALVGTLFGLGFTAALGYFVTRWAHLTGVGTEDDYLLAASAPDMALTSVVMCGIIIAGLGVLNDVTITQASAVWELAGEDPDQRKLFSSAMRIGRDHIASSVYTIAFATAGASLSALLLIEVYARPLWEVAQTEALSQEIVRTLVGAIGLVLSMPLTTAVGVAVVKAGRIGRGRELARTSPAPAEPVTPTAVETGSEDAVDLTGMDQPTEPPPPRPRMDERETTRLPRVHRESGERTDTGGGHAEDSGGTGAADTGRQHRDRGDQPPIRSGRRSRRARDDDETFNFADLHGDDEDDDQPRGKRWR